MMNRTELKVEELELVNGGKTFGKPKNISLNYSPQSGESG